MSRVSWRHLPLALLAASLLVVACDEAIEGPGTQGELAGLTTLENEVPLPGVGLQLRRDGATLSATSDDEGSFGFVDLDAGGWALAVTPPAGYALRSGDANPRSISVVAAERTDVSITLVNEAGVGSIIAEVRVDTLVAGEPESLPVAGVLVTATGPGAQEIIRFARTGDNGLAVIPAPPGEYVVEIELPAGFRMAEGSERRLTGIRVSEGEPTEVGFRLVQDGEIPPASGVIAGTAMLNDVEPVAGLRAELSIDDFTLVDESGADGRFGFEALSDGEWVLAVEPPDGLVLAPDEPNPQTITIGPGNRFQPVNISLTVPEGTGALVAQAFADSALLAGVTMRVYEQDAGTVFESGETNANGRVTLNLEPGTYDVEIVVPDGYALPPGDPARQSGFIVTAGHSVFAWFELLSSAP